MVVLWQSHDDGTLYLESDIDPDSQSHYSKIEVPDEIRLTPEQLCIGNNDLVEVLLRAKQANLIQHEDDDGE